MTMELNTCTVSTYIDVPRSAVVPYARTGDALTEYTLRSRMQSRVDDNTWLGTASGYQSGLYYHSRVKRAGSVDLLEWHCGPELGKYYHVYVIPMFEASYFGSSEPGTYYHWVSWVDPDRATPMIVQGMPAVHTAEARSLKAQLEKRHGRTHAVASQLTLTGNTIYVDVPADQVVAYLGDPANATDWGFMLRKDGERGVVDEYDKQVEVRLKTHTVDGYTLIEHDVQYAEGVVRSPILVIPASYAFAQPNATGCIVHRVSASATVPTSARPFGKRGADEYDAEAINAKRILEGKAGNLASFARGGSYLGLKTR